MPTSFLQKQVSSIMIQPRSKKEKKKLMQPKSLTAIHNQARNVRNQKVLTKLAYVKCVHVLKHSETEGHMNITRIPCIHKDTMVARAFTNLSNIARDPVVRPRKKKSKRKPTSQSRILLFYI